MFTQIAIMQSVQAYIYFSLSSSPPHAGQSLKIPNWKTRHDITTVTIHNKCQRPVRGYGCRKGK